MVWPGPLSTKPSSITWQAGLRLIFSLGLFVVLLGLATASLYHSAQEKAASERLTDLAAFYQSRIAQKDLDWELQSRDFRARIEYARILEDPDADQATIKLQAFMTVQASERPFQYFLVIDKDGSHVFSFGQDLALRDIPFASGVSKGQYLDGANKALYQAYEERIWLGPQRGMGRAAFFYRIDNGLLQSLTSPEVTLTLLHDGKPLASSQGRPGIDAFDSRQAGRQPELKTIPWGEGKDSHAVLAIQAPLKPIFTTTELVMGASMVPIIDGAILWLVLGLWLFRQARRIDTLGLAVKQFSADQAMTPALQASLEKASQGPRDEIHEVAHALWTNFEQTLERERERDAEAAQRALWSSVFHSSGEAIIITDPEHRMVAVNRAFQEKLGYSLEEVLGQDPRMLTDRREDPSFYRDMLHQLRETGFWQGEMWNRHKDGSEHPKLLSISAVHGDDGAVINYIGYYTDISARKQAEAELAGYQKHLEELVQARTRELEAVNLALTQQGAKLLAREVDLKRAQAIARIGSWSLDAREKVLRWSDETYRIFGVERGTPLTYDSFLEKVHPDDRALVDASWQAALRGAPYDFQHRIVVDGQELWVRERAQLELDSDGRFLAGIGTVQDISERKLAEFALQQAKEEAEAASQAKSVFLANMSHELRTPLNAILGFSQLLARDPQLGTPQHEQVGIINRSGEHLLGVINDILDISKIEAGESVVHAEDFDLLDLLKGMEEMFRVRAEAKGLKYALDLDPGLPRHIHADPRKLRQVLINLLGNAVKFTPAGDIRLQVSLAAPDDRALPLQLLFQVEDSGLGIPADELERVFEPFQQGSTGHRLGEGTGLGLSISRRLTHLMGGDIRVESQMDRGTTFRFHLPVQRAHAATVGASAPRRVIGLAPGSEVPRLLVVDDKAVSRLLLRTLLESVGFAVEEAEDGQQATARWQTWQPHLIWMDLRMPVMDGLTATRQIKSLPGGDKTVIIALTASAFPVDRDKFLDAGCADFLSKPFREQEVFDCLARHLRVAYLYEQLDQPPALPESGTRHLTPADLEPLPGSLQAELHQALVEGSLQRVTCALAEVRRHDNALADVLKQLCDRFAYQPILAWLEAGHGQDRDTPPLA